MGGKWATVPLGCRPAGVASTGAAFVGFLSLGDGRYHPLSLEVVPLEVVLLEELLEAAPIQAFPLLASSHVHGET